MNQYHKFVDDVSSLVKGGRALPLGGLSPAPKPNIPETAPTALFFSPHPDDECISGGIAVRIMREAGMRVINVAVTQGSNKARQAARFEELSAACNYIGFDILRTSPTGLERITPKTRQQDPAYWSGCVDIIHRIINEHRPRVMMFPHEHDWNGTHIGTHFLIMDALKRMPADFECFLVETEFWGQMVDPNLMVELGNTDLADMIAGTSFHVGEVQRNPYHLLLPAWTMDNVRRGGELVGGQGGAAPDFTFAALYRLRKWAKGEATRFYQGGRQISSRTNIGVLFA